MIQEDLFRTRIASTGISIEVVGILADVNPSQICRWLNGQRPLPGAEITQLDKTLQDLEGLAAFASPFLLPAKNANKLKILLAQFRDGHLGQPRAMAVKP